MFCPLCFKSIENDDTIYLNEHGNLMEPNFLDVKPGKLPKRPGGRRPVREERFMAHESCDCLHPLVSFKGREPDANKIFQAAVRTNSDKLKGLITGVLPTEDWGEISPMTSKHWSFVRMSYLALKYQNMKSMWFPERLFPWVDEEQSYLAIFVRGPRAAGKSVFATMAGSLNSYVRLGDGVNFQENFGYAAPRRAETPYEDYRVLLKNMNSVKFESAQIQGTDKQSSMVVAAFFNKCLPGSEIDTVTVYDVAGELHEEGLNERTEAMRMDRMYWCIVVTVEDLRAFQYGEKTKAASLHTALGLIKSAGEHQRIVIAVTKTDTIEWATPPHIRQDAPPPRRGPVTASPPSAEEILAAKARAAELPKARAKARDRALGLSGVFDKVRALTEPCAHVTTAGQDSGNRRDEHRRIGEHGKTLLIELLDEDDLREASLKQELSSNPNIRAVFFTGVAGWEKAKQDVRPFGIGEAICWMAEDLSGGSQGGQGVITETLQRFASWFKLKFPGKQGATTA